MERGDLILEKKGDEYRIYVGNPHEYVLFSGERQMLQNHFIKEVGYLDDGFYKLEISYGGFGGSKIENISSVK